jgi:hypothetical protein
MFTASVIRAINLSKQKPAENFSAGFLLGVAILN